jgi:hypothetical protein
MAGTVGNIVIGGAAVELANGTDLGFIKDGLHLSKEEEIYYVTGVEGIPTPPMAHRTSLQYSMSGTLIEPTLLNIQKVYAAGDKTTPMSMGLATEMDIVNGTVNEWGYCNILFKTASVAAGTLREIEAAKAVADGPGEMVFSDAEEVSLPFTFKVIWDGTRSIIITDS